MEPLCLLSLVSAALPSGTGNYELFRSSVPEHKNRWPAFVFSAALHAILIPAFALVAPWFAGEANREFRIRTERVVRTLTIRLPERLYVASTGSSPARPRPVRTEGQRRNPAPSGRASVSAPKAARRRLELPPLPRHVANPRTLLQPEFAQDQMISRPMELPEVFFWSPQRQTPQYVKPYITPGHQTPPKTALLLDAPPKLQAPAPERTGITIPPGVESRNALGALASAALPVRIADPSGETPRTGASADTTPGDPAAILSLAANPLRLREFLSVPSGNQMGRIPEAGRSGSGSMDMTAAPGAGGGNSGGRGSGAGNTGAGTGAGTGTATGNGAEPGRGDGDSAAAPAMGLREAALTAAAATRVVHPITGVFDVVVQSSAVNGFPESAGVLSGRPVYSVYVAAGGAKDYVLQYCIPASEDRSTEQAGGVVRLGNSAPVSAPYPRVTERPPVKPRAGRYLMIHGFISAAGRFEDLKLLGASDPNEVEMVPAVLNTWEFRPAMRGGQALRVEILLGIPTG